MKKITVENCLDESNKMIQDEGEGENGSRWCVVYELCTQLGMDEDNITDIEDVVNFITGLSERPKLVDPPLPMWWKIVLRVLTTPVAFLFYGVNGLRKLW